METIGILLTTCALNAGFRDALGVPNEGKMAGSEGLL